MKYLESYQDYELSESDKSDINDIFNSTISDDDMLKFEGEWYDDDILYSITNNSLKLYVGRKCVDKFIDIHPVIRRFIKISENLGYYPHILNNYQSKKKFGRELEDYTLYLKIFYEHGGNPEPLIILL